MDEKTTHEKSETKSEPEQTKHEHIEPKKDPFSLIGKIAVVVVVLGLLIGGGIFLGMTFSKNQKSATNTLPSLSPTTSAQVSPSVSTSSGQTISPTSIPSSPETKTVTGGGGNGSSFGVYVIAVPTGWSYKDEKSDVIDKLKLEKNGYTLSIYQAAMGGGGCLYPGDPPSEMSQTFTDFVEIQGSQNIFRRSWNITGNPPGSITYTVCQKSSSGNSYGLPTMFGVVSVSAPDPTDAAMMKEIDSMISSLVKK